jgi:hypothetical protein
VVSDRAAVDLVEAAYLDEAGLSRVDAFARLAATTVGRDGGLDGEGCQYADRRGVDPSVGSVSAATDEFQGRGLRRFPGPGRERL